MNAGNTNFNDSHGSRYSARRLWLENHLKRVYQGRLVPSGKCVYVEPPENICSIPDEKFIIDMQGTGNTVSSSIPIVLSKRLSDGSFVQGDKILLFAGFGVGYSWAGVVITV